jgi:hypothetical protein
MKDELKPDPCRCPVANEDCRRAGHPMVGRLYELCSGNCPPESPCSPALSEQYRSLWDKLPVPALQAHAAPQRPEVAAAMQAPMPPAPTAGPGTELMELLKSLGIQESPGCACNAKARQMNAWGVAGCKERRDEIVQWLRDGQQLFGWKEKLTAAANAARTGLAFHLNWLDPIPGMFEEALRRAEGKQ